MTFTPQQLDMRPPGSILDWRIFDDGFIADGYRILHMGPRNWLVTCDDTVVGSCRRLKTAFISAERHHRASIRADRVKTTAITVVSVLMSWVLLIGVLEWQAPGLWILFPITLLGMSSVLRLIARTTGNAKTAYFGPMPVAIKHDAGGRDARRRYYRA